MEIENKTYMCKSKMKRPDQIKAYLDKFVIGQDEAKKVLSVSVYNHYKRIIHQNDPEKVANVDKSNVLLLGSTGSGKTLMVKKLAKMLGVPCYIGSATSLTASGYVGDDVESLLSGLLMESGYNVEKAQQGIIFIDEIDKIAGKEAGSSILRDVSGTCVQQALLKMIEGHLVGAQPFGGRKHPEQSLIYVDTSNILFILSGAFVGLDEIVARRLGRDKAKIGFQSAAATSSQGNILAEVTPQDLRDYGMIPEFVGRIPIITYVDPLDVTALERILTEPEDSLVSQYTELMREDGVELTFEPEALKAIAQKAVDLGTGARGLRAIMEEAMRDIMFNAPRKAAWKVGKKVNITADMIKSAETPQSLSKAE